MAYLLKSPRPPGRVARPRAGLTLALLMGYPLLTTRWIGWSLVLFGISGAAFSVSVAPLHKKLLANVRAGIAGGWDENEYRALSRSWGIWGAVATGAPPAALVLMVFKPA
jgi:uncharacterized membrane protein